MAPQPAVLSLATALPPHVLVQSEVAKAAREIFADQLNDFSKISQVFETSNVVTRRAIRPLEWYLEPRGWPERTEAYLQGAGDLFVEAAQKALDAAELTGADVDIVITVSSSGIATPSLDARLIDRLGLRESVSRIPVFGLGCAAGVTGLGLASRLASAAPGKNILFVAVETCTLAVRPDKLTAANIVSTALFGDGAAALVLRAGEREGLGTIKGAAEHTWRNTLDVMGWDIDPEGFGVILSGAVPHIAQTRLGPALKDMLERLNIEIASIDRFVCHPGGPKVILAIESVLDMVPGTLDHEREILATHGNMSAPTVLFILERVIAGGMPDHCLLTAMGPGFTATCLSLERNA